MSDQEVDLGIWDKLLKAVVCLLIVAALMAVAVWYLPLIRQNERMRQEILRMDAQVQVEEDALRQQKQAVEVLRTDPLTVERQVRERLGLARAGETVFRFEEPDPERR